MPNSRPAGEVCPFCGSRGEPWDERQGYLLRHCRCVEPGTLLSWQWPSVAAYEALYTAPGAYHEEAQRGQGQAPSLARDTEHLAAARSRLELLRQWVSPSATLCDVGCGTGAFVAAARAFGYEAAGFDPCRELVKFGRRIGRELREGSWQAVQGHSAVITLHDVLEHLAEPLACLTHLRERLWPGGLLVVEIPEAFAPDPAWQKHIRPLQHVALYSDPAARELFRRAGLKVEMMHRPVRCSLGKISYYLSAE